MFIRPLIQSQQLAFETVQSATFYAKQEAPAVIYSVRATPDGVIFRTTPGKLQRLAVYLRNSSMYRFGNLSETAVVDRIRRAGRFIVNYHLLSTTLNQRVTMQLSVSETEPIPSLLGSPLKRDRLYPAAN